MGVAQAAGIEHGADVACGKILRIGFRQLWHLRRRIAARIEGDALETRRPGVDLKVKRRAGAAQLMHQHDGRAGAVRLVVQREPVAGFGRQAGCVFLGHGFLGHGSSLRLCVASTERLYFAARAFTRDGSLMDFGFTEEQRLLRDSVRKLMQKHAPPDYVRRHDRERSYPEDLFQAWVEAGLLALPFPEEYGGAGGSVMDMVVVAEEIARVSADLVMAYSGNIFCGLNLVRKASEEQKRAWLPQLFAGKIKFSISMSEPDAGSDIGAMRTIAVRDGNEWVIDGRKIWASMAGANNNIINLYVKTDPKAHYRQGLSLFLVDKDTPGLTLRKLDMLGRRSTGTYEL